MPARDIAGAAENGQLAALDTADSGVTKKKLMLSHVVSGYPIARIRFGFPYTVFLNLPAMNTTG